MIYICLILLPFPFRDEVQIVKNILQSFYTPLAYKGQAERDNFAIKRGSVKKGELWMVAEDRKRVALYRHTQR